jgi:hypothetical protein
LSGALARLQAHAAAGAVSRAQVTPDKEALQIAVFGLAHQAADDFNDVVLLGHTAMASGLEAAACTSAS